MQGKPLTSGFTRKTPNGLRHGKPGEVAIQLLNKGVGSSSVWAFLCKFKKAAEWRRA